MRKITFYLIIAYFVLQLAVPGYFVYRYFDTLNTGESYKFVVAPYDPYDPFRGRYVALRPIIPMNSAEGEYAILEKNSTGYAIISKWSKEKPLTGQYVKKLNLNRYYMNEKMAPKAERIQRELDWDKDKTYLIVKVKKGNYVIQGLYINDVPIEQYIENTASNKLPD